MVQATLRISLQQARFVQLATRKKKMKMVYNISFLKLVAMKVARPDLNIE
jgi:hypothetical protein